MATEPAFGELQSRIQQDLDHFEGTLPEPYALSWYGYLAALIEWGLISPDVHARLIAMLPSIADNPATAILLGRDDD
jgi:hypothetical protein